MISAEFLAAQDCSGSLGEYAQAIATLRLDTVDAFFLRDNDNPLTHQPGVLGPGWR